MGERNHHTRSGPRDRDRGAAPSRPIERLRGISRQQLIEEILATERARLNECDSLNDLLRYGHGTYLFSLVLRGWEWGRPKVAVETFSEAADERPLPAPLDERAA